MTKKTKNVTISLDEYLELREFKQSVLKRDSIKIYIGFYGQQKIEFITESKMIDQIKQGNERLRKYLVDVSEMNYFEFKKWRNEVNFKD